MQDSSYTNPINKLLHPSLDPIDGTPSYYTLVSLSIQLNANEFYIP